MGLNLESVGGAQMDLLWTNPAPTSIFPSQSINIPLSGYDFILVLATAYYQRPYYLPAVIGFVGYGISIVSYGDTNNVLHRYASITEDGIKFENVSGATQNMHAIPQKIYGIKF